MKKFLSTLSLFLIFLVSAIAQESFYFTFAEKKPLQINKESFSVIFEQKVSWQKFVRSTHPLIKEVHGIQTGPAKRVIFELNEAGNASLEELVHEFFINPGIVKDMHWGFKINPLLPVWLTDELLYKPSHTWDEKTVADILTRYPGAKLQQNELGLFSITLSELSHSLSLSNELVESGMVLWAQPDFMGGFSLFYTPSDRDFYEQYSFHNIGQWIDGQKGTTDIDINAPECWGLSLGSSSIIVGMIDEGVEDHEDLKDGLGASRLLPGYSAEGLGNGEPQTQFEGHGQSVAGLIGASHNSLGIAGVAPNSKLVSAYVTANLTTVVSNVSNSMAWMWQVGNADIINNSYGFKSCDPNLYPAVVSAIDDAQLNGRGGKGCVVIFATGENDGGQTCVNFPGNRSNVISVGAIDNSGNIPYYAPIGPAIDVVVPSQGASANVRSIDREDMALDYASRTGLDSGNYVSFFGGTSASCAIASGVAALILSEDPTLRYTDVEAIFNTTTMDLGAPGKTDTTGNGLLKADAAVSAAIGGFPVEWLDFKGELHNDGVNLEWITANERNNASFEVERSVGGVFMRLGSLPGAGTDVNLNTYTFRDQNPHLGKNYYRIKQIDINGTFSYSAVLEINRNQVTTLAISEVYPNPSHDWIQMDFALPRGVQAEYKVVDLQGRILLTNAVQREENIQGIKLDVSAFSPGIYVLVMKSSQGNTLSKRFLVSR